MKSSILCIVLETTAPSEEELCIRKKNNIIIFGLLESHATESKAQTEMEVQSLFHDMSLHLNAAIDVQSMSMSMYRVGRPSADKNQPVVIKLTTSDMKKEVLFKARSLKGNPMWQGVAITDDLTKLQCLGRNHELKLRHEAEKYNSMFSEMERQIKVWKVGVVVVLWVKIENLYLGFALFDG